MVYQMCGERATKLGLLRDCRDPIAAKSFLGSRIVDFVVSASICALHGTTYRNMIKPHTCVCQYDVELPLETETPVFEKAKNVRNGQGLELDFPAIYGGSARQRYGLLA